MDSMPSTSGDSVVSPPTTAAAASPPLPPSLPTPSPPPPPPPSSSSPLAHNHQQLSRYESQKRRDWNTFMQYLKSHNPPVTLPRCSGSHVIDFLKYLDQFGKTKVHSAACPFFGHPKPPEPCACPLRQAWGSLDALIGRLRAAYDENDGKPETNPFGARAVRMYLREVKECQAKARGIPYEKKKRKRHHAAAAAAAAATMENTARCATSNSIQALGAKVEEETADPPKNTWTS